MTDQRKKINKINLLSWLILPIFLVVLSINYLLAKTDHSISAVIASQRKAQESVLATKNDQHREIKDFNYQGTGLVTFWFDDAWLSQYIGGMPTLKEAGLTGAVAVPTKLIGYPDYMSWTNLKRLEYLGWEITSHTRTHRCDLDKATQQELSDEVIGAAQDLEDQGFNPDIYVAPCGVLSQEMINLTKKNYISLRTVEDGLNSIPVSDPYDIKVKEINKTTTIEEIENMLTEAKEKKYWLILMFHQVDQSETYYSVTPFKLAEIAQVVKSSELPVVLPSQVIKIK